MNGTSWPERKSIWACAFRIAGAEFSRTVSRVPSAILKIHDKQSERIVFAITGNVYSSRPEGVELRILLERD